MTDKEGQTIEVAPHAQMEVRIKTDKPYPVNSILRKSTNIRKF